MRQEPRNPEGGLQTLAVLMVWMWDVQTHIGKQTNTECPRMARAVRTGAFRE